MRRSKSILLVEEDKDDQEFFMEALSEIENATLYDVANNGKEALDRLENSVILPDLILRTSTCP
jgi:CheY-like chemotaxis protein